MMANLAEVEETASKIGSFSWCQKSQEYCMKSHAKILLNGVI